MCRLKALHGLLAVIHKSETCRTTTTKVRAHAEHRDLFLGGLVQLANLFLQLAPRHVRAGWVDHLKHHLPALEQTVAKELAGPQGDGGVQILSMLACLFMLSL